MKLFKPFLLGAALPLLAACAPRTQPVETVRPTVSQNSVSFYPFGAGLAWSYVPEGETASDVPYVMRGQGPNIFMNQSVQATQMTGRGADQTWYRQIDGSGVRLLGFRKPGMTVSLTPAWQEYPAEGAWQVGLVWQGQSAITVMGDDEKVKAQGTLNYRYEVQDRRQVKTPAGNFDVWVVTRQMNDTVGGLFPATEQVWFAPFVGEVRTPEGLVLTARNFAVKGK